MDPYNPIRGRGSLHGAEVASTLEPYGSTASVRPWVAIRIWDLPTRLFHWALVVCVFGAVSTALIGGNAMIWHGRLGLAIGALLLFRLVWGVVGGRWSRFSSFLHSPAAFRRYLRGEVRPGDAVDVGHNPLGSLSVFALLMVLLGQVLTGVVADDEIAFTGPLFALVSEATSHGATRFHKTVGQFGLYLLVAGHLAAIAFYGLRRGKDLVTPMLKGDKWLPPQVPASADGRRERLRALVIVMLCAALAVWVSRLGG